MITAWALCLALIPAIPASAATHTVSNSEQFHNALANAKNGDTIQVSGSIVVKNPASNNDSLVIDKAVTIQGGSLTFWYAGVLLGADVTFKNITLGLASNMRNALMANGHTLTLENVTRGPTARYIHLFCGGQTGATQGALSAEKQGEHGKVILKGNTNLGLANIYAGSISTDGTDNEFTKPATVTIDPSVMGQPIEHIYACGALQTPTSENDWFDYEHEIAPPTPSAEKYPVSGAVDFNLYGTAVKEVDGRTGKGYAAVAYSGKNYLNDSLVLKNIGGLHVHSGNLTPASGSAFGIANAPSLGVDANATLGLNNMGNVTAGNFTGGGSLVLGQSQKLTVSGTVSGSTTVGIGGIFNGHSQAIPAENFNYINAPSSNADSFTLAAPASRPDIQLSRDENGAWTATKDENVVIVNDFNLASAVVEASSGDDIEPPTLAFQNVQPAEIIYPFSSIQLAISVNNTATTVTDDGSSYTYSTDTLTLFVAVNDNQDGEVLQVINKTNETAPVPTGTYIISVTVPASNSGTGQPITRTATLTVKAESGDTPIPAPVANTGLVYSGQEQAGVPVGGAYVLVSGTASATDAGEYTATVKPANGFTWERGGNEGKDISWSIAKAEGPAAPTGLAGIAPSACGEADGRITGTTAGMEYSTGTGFTDSKPCTDGGTAVPAGTYYVRMKESANYKAGARAMAIVPEGPLAIQSIAIDSSSPYKTAYQTGETLDVTGLTLTVTMSNGSTYTVPVAAGMVSGFNSRNPIDSLTLTVSYGGQTATYTVSITGDPVPGGGDSGNTGGNGGSTGGDGGSTGGDGGSTGGDNGSTGGDNGGSNTTTNPDGSVTTTVTDPATGTVTSTTKKPDGSTTVVEAKKDGTVTITDTAKNGVIVETVAKPDTDTTVRVTVPTPVETATVTVPGAVTPGTVAIDAKTGEIVKLSLPTGDGMAIKLDGSADLVLVDRSRPFTDIGGHWAKDSIDFATAHNMFNGTSPTTFSPNSPMTRGMVAVVLHNFEGNPDFNTQNGFADVGPDAWYADGVYWMVEKGIATGYGDGTFGTNSFVTREQLVTFLYRYAKSVGYSTDGGTDLSGFTDGGSVSGYAAEAMEWAVGSGLINGTGGGALSPRGSATRAQVAAILNRFVANLTR